MTQTSRFATVSRRAVLQGMSAAALLGLTGCATDDAAVLKPSAGSQSPDATAGATASAGASVSASPAATASAAAGEYVIAFSYTADTSATAAAGEGGGRGPGGSHGPGGGMVRNPYIAVWLEDTAGKLVKTISLWHLQNGQDRWLSELHRWYSASGGVDTVSSATRAAGSYSVAWDGTDADGQPVAGGNYVLCIEATREHGPYSLITAEVALSGKKLTTDLPANGELSGASLAFTPA